MSQRREIEGRLALYDDLTGILGAMRSFALAELRKVGKRETAQQEIVASLSAALLDLSGGLPAALYADPSQTAGDIWLLFGSVRGFCGSFNEDVMRFWRGRADQNNTVLLVGERLHAMIAETTPAQRLSGAEGSLDAPIVIERILAAIMALRGSVEFGLMACIRDEKGVLSHRLWPLPPRRQDRQLSAVDLSTVRRSGHWRRRAISVSCLAGIAVTLDSGGKPHAFDANGNRIEAPGKGWRRIAAAAQPSAPGRNRRGNRIDGGQTLISFRRKPYSGKS